ncbi:MAG: hypothetical protein IJ512_05140 [Ruminococcus sp.]|nr:hypothetical protein [Ruminococcus sp.]
MTLLTAGYVYYIEKLRKKRLCFLLMTALLLLLYLAGFAVWSVYLYGKLWQMDSFLRFCPFGAAFFVLQGIRFVWEIFSGRIAAVPDPFQTAEYLLFYPRLVMGPVQSYEEHAAMCSRAELCSAHVGSGLGKFILGLSKKVLLADTIGLAFSALYRPEYGDISVVMTWVMLLAFVLQLYFTAAGYADMAKGISLCYGFQLPDSYGYPAVSGSLADFGEQWNQSVVKWCRGCFSPMLHVQKWQYVLGMVASWMLLGCWYRPGLQMLFWGIWMGLWIGLDQYLKNKLTRKIPGVIEGLVFILVTFTGWAVFSAPTLADGIHRLGLLFGGGGRFSQDRDLYFIQSGGMILLIALYSATGHFASLLEKSQQIPILSKIRGILTLPVQAGLLVLCLALIVTQQDTSVLL